MLIYSNIAERTEKISLGSVKRVISEPIKGHEEYHIIVSYIVEFGVNLACIILKLDELVTIVHNACVHR